MGGFLSTEQQFVPAVKKEKRSEAVKKSQIKVDQNELDSMGLKDGENASPKAEPERKEESPSEKSEPDQGAAPSKDTQEEAPAQNTQPENSDGAAIVNQKPAK